MTDRCYLFDQEARIKRKHLSQGEDPNDLDVVISDVRHSLRQTMQMVKADAQKHGINLREEREELARERRSSKRFASEHPLRKKSMRFAKDAHQFLETLAREIQSESFKGVDLTSLAEIQECFEVLSWYHMQQAVKINRAVEGLWDAVHCKDQDDFHIYDSNGSAKIAHLGLLKMLDVLTKVHQWNAGWNRSLIPLINNLYEIIEDVDQHFPGHKTFKRPGFDD